MATDDWTILGMSSSYDQNDEECCAIPEELLPALAFQYRVTMGLRLDIPSFGGIGMWANTPYVDGRTISWQFWLLDKASTGRGGEDSEVLRWRYDDAYRDDLDGLFEFNGILMGLQALRFVWEYTTEGFQVITPSSVYTLPARTFMAEDTWNEYVRVMSPHESEMHPGWGEDYSADYYWLLVDWYSPVLCCPLPADGFWNLNFSTSFGGDSEDDSPGYWWSVAMRRLAGPGGGLADQDADSILHAGTIADGLRTTESIGGEALWTDRKVSTIDLDWGCYFHTPDGRLGVLGWDGMQAVLAWSPDGGTTWDSTQTLPGRRLPLDCRVDHDGQIHALRWDGSAVVYERIARSGGVLYSSPVYAGAVMAASILPQKDGSLLTRLIVGKTAKFYRSWDGGLEWGAVS